MLQHLCNTFVTSSQHPPPVLAVFNRLGGNGASQSPSPLNKRGRQNRSEADDQDGSGDDDDDDKWRRQLKAAKQDAAGKAKQLLSKKQRKLMDARCAMESVSYSIAGIQFRARVYNYQIHG